MNNKIKRILYILMLLNIIAVFTLPTMAQDNKRTVRVSCGMNNALYLDDKGKPVGSFANFIQQLGWVCNWNVVYVEDNWNNSVQNLYDDKIDLLFPTQKTSDRMDKMGFSNYIGGYQPVCLFAKTGSDIYYDDFQSFNGKKVAVSAGSSNAESLKEYASKHGFTYQEVSMDSTQDKIDALNGGKVDLILFSTLNDVPGGKIVSTIDYLPFYFSVNIKNQQLLNELNTGIEKIMTHHPNQVVDIYSAVLKGKNNIAFTKGENDVIKKTDQLRVGIYDDSLPISGTDENGNPIGIDVGFLRAIERNSGIKIKIIPVPRKDFLYDYLDEGKVDFVVSSRNLPYNSKDVSKYMLSEGLEDYNTITVTRKNYQISNGKKTVFALTKAREYLKDDILKSISDAEFVYLKDAKECLVALQKGKVDATMLNTWEYNYHSRNPRFSNTIESTYLSENSTLILGTKANVDPLLSSVIEKSIEQISKQERANIINSNLNMSYSNYDFEDIIYKNRDGVIIGGSIALISVLSLLIYSLIRKKYVSELENKNQQLEQANQLKTNFMSRMSHELRTPLNAITGYTTELQNSVENHSINEGLAEESLAAIQKASKYQLTIINDLLDIQEIESGKIKLAKEEVDFDFFMNNVVNMIKTEAESKNIDFIYEGLPKVKETYVFDDIRFQQILLNILHNATKFTDNGGTIKMSVAIVETGEKENRLKFVISDTGIGMSKEFMESQLFNIFSQENQGNTSPYEGCGIGMAICKKLLVLMGGTIECESEKGKGTTFTINVGLEHIEKKRKRRKRLELPPSDLIGIKVLLCEDNPTNQEIEKRLLEKLGCVVETADNGKIGCEFFENSEINHYDVVLMDIRMPEMDGLEATKHIRAMDRADAKAVPIIAVSANAFEEDVQMSINAGMNEHLSKPMDVRLVREKIKQYCKVA